MSFRSVSRGVRSRATAYASLVRVPNLFTAPPDVLVGSALAAAAGGVVSLRATAGLAVGSALLYAGGTTLNDYFDAPIDAEERPERPIPSGEVPRSNALALGLGLLGGGATVAFLAGGASAGVVAGLLALAILLYDGALKSEVSGFAAMGATRGLNVLLGTTATGVAVADLPGWALGVPVAVAAYIAAVTYMAAEEATGGERRAVAVAGAGAVAVALAALALLWSVRMGTVRAGAIRPTALSFGTGVALVAGFLAWTGHALGSAYRDPTPETVGPAVGTCVLGLVVVDAAFAAVAGAGWSLVTLAFLVPAVGLSRAFDVS